MPLLLAFPDDRRPLTSVVFAAGEFLNFFTADEIS